MSVDAGRFYNALPKAASIAPRDLVGLFVYFLIVERVESTATVTAIEKCFHDCDLAVPPRLARYLSEGVNAGKFLKAERGYKLQRHYREEISALLGANRTIVQTSTELRKLEGKITIASEKEFLRETLDCFEAGANRATIVMCWILALDHLYEYVFKTSLPDFNKELAKVTDKRVKVSEVRSRDDFGDIPENKFIELLRAAGIISNDVRKILDAKLGIRNSCAHPSGIAIKPSKVVEFIDDLIENVVSKY